MTYVISTDSGVYSDVVFNEDVHVTGTGNKFRGCTVHGKLLITGGRSWVRDTTIRYTGEYGLGLWNSSGAWVSGCHIDGGGVGGPGVSIGNWDTAYFSDILIEEPLSGFRVSGIGNLWLSNVVTDRNRSVGYHIEPPADKVAQNIQMANIWAAKGAWPMFLNATDGPVRNVQIANAYFTDFTNKSIWNVGATNLQQANVLHV